MKMPDASLDVARLQLGMSMMDLWVEYFALGGNLDAHSLGGYLRGERDVTNAQHDMIAHALNETFQDRGLDSPIAYRG